MSIYARAALYTVANALLGGAWFAALIYTTLLSSEIGFMDMTVLLIALVGASVLTSWLILPLLPRIGCFTASFVQLSVAMLLTCLLVGGIDAVVYGREFSRSFSYTLLGVPFVLLFSPWVFIYAGVYVLLTQGLASRLLGVRCTDTGGSSDASAGSGVDSVK
jgi:hypothetical protein